MAELGTEIFHCPRGSKVIEFWVVTFIESPVSWGHRPIGCVHYGIAESSSPGQLQVTEVEVSD